VTVVDACLQRIERLNPKLNALGTVLELVNTFLTRGV